MFWAKVSMALWSLPIASEIVRGAIVLDCCGREMESVVEDHADGKD